MDKQQIKQAVLNMYPDAIINNDLFFDEEVLKDFSLEDIAYRLSGLIYGDNLYKYLYGNSGTIFIKESFPVMREMVKYIAVNNIDYFSLDDKELFYKGNILKEYERLYKGLNFSLEDLDKCNNDNLKNNAGKPYYSFDLFYYNEFIMIQKLYKEKKIKVDDISDFIEFNINFLKNKIVGEFGNYDVKYDRYINEIVGYFLMGNISLDSLYLGISNDDMVKNLLYMAKLGVKGYDLDKISIEVIGALSGKKIKRIYDIVEGKFDICEYFDKDEFMSILVNMCVLLSDEVVDNIVRHLPDSVDSIERLFLCFREINLNDVEILNNRIVYNGQFIKFFVGDSFMEPTSLLNLIYDDKTSLGKNIEELYYCWDELGENFGKQKLLTKTAFFEQSFTFSKVLVDPDEYKLEGEIINSYYDNCKYQKLTSLQVIKELREIYKVMRHNYQKSIPYVNGSYKGYKYETLKANDPGLFKMGADCDCCFKIGGDASLFVKYCATDKNARVLSIKDQSDNVVAMVPMVRNGNLVLCNSVESNNKDDFEFMSDMFEVLEMAGNEIIKISSENEAIDNMIGAVLISNYINDIRKFGKYKVVSSLEIDDECICLLKDGIYSNIDVKYCGNYYISYDKRFDSKKFRSFDPDVLYEDPRSSVLELESEYVDDSVKKVINSIYYELEKRVLDFDDVEKVIFNEDWFIFIDKRHKIISGIVGSDSRAMLEYQEYLELEKEYCSYYDLAGNVKSDFKYR